MNESTGARRVFPVMGTMSSIVVPAGEVARHGLAAVDRALGAARGELEMLDRRFSHYRADSEITRWQLAEQVSNEAVADIGHVLAECARLAADSEGVFTTRNPRTGALDTAGYVKGYAIGRAADVLGRAGLASFAVGVGGDGYFAGMPAQGRPWQVAVQHPERRFGVVAVIPVIDGAVATSGTAERGEHIWMGDEQPTGGTVASFTVVGPSIAEADAYATIGFAMGEAGPAWVARHGGYRSLLVRADGSAVSDAALVSAA
ncbi:MAG: FAD:protein FMN transferase [Actinomycetales bacterium]|nr:FAD:protein FMN transferase [Actinomycetales bacterium]